MTLPLTAAPVIPWTYDELFSKAELIVIAKAIKSTKPAPGTEMSEPIPTEYAAFLVSSTTEFRVKYHVKGESPGTIILEHLAHPSVDRITNGPNLFKFRTEVEMVHGNGWAAEKEFEYLLF